MRRGRVGGRALRVDDERDPRMAAEALARRLMKGVEVVLREPVARELVRRPDAQVVAVDGKEPARPDPVVEDGRRERPSQTIEETGPKVIQHGSRPHLRTELSTLVDSSGHHCSKEFRAATRVPRDTTPHAGPSHDGWRTLARGESGSQESSQADSRL